MSHRPTTPPPKHTPPHYHAPLPPLPHHLRYSPFRMARFREIFLKTDNFIGGRYFAELTRDVLNRQEATGKSWLTEYRLSIYGKSPGEWKKLADWVMGRGEHVEAEEQGGGDGSAGVDGSRNTRDFSLLSENNRWLIQVPRSVRLVVLTACVTPRRHDRTTAPPRHRATAPPHHRATAPPHHRTTAPPQDLANPIQ